jgi:CheY-like chemotaxis protein
MKAKYPVRIVWVDDDPNNIEITKNLKAKRKELEIEFISQLNQFENFLAKQEVVDLFLVDDRLFLRSESSFNRRGLSVVAQIREKFPEIPVYMFSAVKEESGIYANLAEAAKSLADRILELKDIQREGHEILYYDSIDYRKIRESPRESVKNLLGLLNAPEDDHERIISALPESLKSGLSSQHVATRAEGNVIAFAKWVKRVFLRLPGFVYSSLYSATMLGITEESFRSIESKFKEAKYTGVFEKTSPSLWWSSELRNILFRLACSKEPKSDITDPRKLTPQLFRLKDSQMSRCTVCGEKYPETVGINKDDENDLKPVHYRCSIPHPIKTRVLYFEEARQFSEG